MPGQAPSAPNINRQGEIVCGGRVEAKGWTLKTRDPTCVTFHHMCRDAWLAPLGNSKRFHPGRACPRAGEPRTLLTRRCDHTCCESP